MSILLKQLSDLTLLYNMTIKYENMVLASDILTLYNRVCKMFQSEKYQFYEIVDTISDLKKCLEVAYLSQTDEISGIYYK